MMDELMRIEDDYGIELNPHRTIEDADFQSEDKGLNVLSIKG